MDSTIVLIILLGLTLLVVSAILLKTVTSKNKTTDDEAINLLKMGHQKEMELLQQRIDNSAKQLEETQSELINHRDLLSQCKIELATEKAAVSHHLQKEKKDQERIGHLESLTSKLQEQLNESEKSNGLFEAQLKAQKEAMADQEEKVLGLQKQFSDQFNNLAQKIFEEKSSKFTEQNRVQIDQLLKPVEKNLNEFKQLVRDTYALEDKSRHVLGEEVKKLMQLNLQIEKEARDLTEALKGSTKQQGDWGEMVLETILQQSGLAENRQYFKQETLRNDLGEVIKGSDGKAMRPDIIVHYPDARKLIIDSKVSLNAYVEFTSADDAIEQEQAIKKLMISVKKHIDELSAKKYPEYGSDLDFVMMFIPVEGAYIAALQNDPLLWEYAYKRNVLLIGPTNIIAALRMVADMWDRDNQSKNAEEIASRGGKLLEKFIGFTRSLDEVGTFLEKSSKSYQKAVSQLSEGRGNLVRQAESLKSLGVKYDRSRQIPGRFRSDSEDEKESGGRIE